MRNFLHFLLKALRRSAAPEDDSVTTFDLARLEPEMDRDVEPLAVRLRSIRLTAQEKDRMLEQILAAPPLRGGALLFFSLSRTLSLSFVVLLLLGSGISYAAESALPGETLYTVKVHVNEPLQGAFKRSPRARAQWETRLTERRLEEGEELAARGRMDAKLQAEVAAQVRAHADRVAQHVTAFLNEEDVEAATELTAHFEATLHAHASVLARLQRGRAKDAVGGLITEVQRIASSTHQTRSRAVVHARTIARVETGHRDAANATVTTEEKISDARSVLLENAETSEQSAPSSRPADPALRVWAQAEINTAVIRITGARTLLAKRKVELTAEEVRKAEIALTLADTALLNARARMETQAFVEARTIADEAIAHVTTARKIIKRQPLDQPEEDEEDREEIRSPQPNVRFH